MNVLQLSPTPLVMSPELLSDALNRFTDFHSNTIVFNDYPGEKKRMFVKNAIVYDKNTEEIIVSLIEKADIINIHNFMTDKMVDLINKHSHRNAKFVYITHSPKNEGPLFFDIEKASDIDFDKKLVIGQYQPRQYQDFTIVPNITMFDQPLEISENEVPKVMFNPSHTKVGGRWNDKTSLKLNDTIQAMHKLELIELINITDVRPDILFEYRKQADITIDEIVTGAYHKVSLEGLCAGNITINNADFFSTAMLTQFAKTNTPPPFFHANENNIKDVILNIENIKDEKEKTLKYYKENLMPDHLISFYVDEYKDLV